MADHVDLDWELRQLLRQARLPQQSWESGALATVFGRAGVLAAPLGEVPLPQCLPRLAGQGFAPMWAAYANEETSAKKQDTTKEKPAVLIQNTGNLKKTDEEARQAALEDWLDLICKAGKESTLLESASGGGTIEVKSSLEDAMASKATGTLRRRAASLILFIDWRETNLLPPFPITEERVYSYTVTPGRQRGAGQASQCIPGGTELRERDAGLKRGEPSIPVAASVCTTPSRG